MFIKCLYEKRPHRHRFALGLTVSYLAVGRGTISTSAVLTAVNCRRFMLAQWRVPLGNVPFSYNHVYTFSVFCDC